MGLVEETIRRETKSLVEDDVKLRVIGRLHELSDPLQKAIAGAVEATSGGRHGVMTLAFNYGGRGQSRCAGPGPLAEGGPSQPPGAPPPARRPFTPAPPRPQPPTPPRLEP